jgi:tRNA(fMet)-specific endonuclease VapC
LTFLPDTNIVVASLKKNPRVAKRLGELAPDQLILCAPVLAELRFGACHSIHRQENLERLDRLAARVRVEDFGLGAARWFGEIKANLRRKGIPKSDFDLAIASVALDLGVTLVSNDQTFHDQQIGGLLVEDWLSD